MPVVSSSSPKSGDPSTTVLGERYSLTTRIAIGGMGEVWAATDLVLGREVAVKILRHDLVDSPVFLERFRAEARHTASLTHRGIAGVFDYGEDHRDGQRVAYLVMELIPGQPLSKVMASRGALPISMALSLLAQTAEALHAAHVFGVVHRDVKPGNLLLLDDGAVKVTDFGIARAASSVALTEVGQVIGTAMYISPEQAIGAEATPASDIYSLGVIGYEMLAGHPPFTADNTGALAMAHVHQPLPPLPASVPAPVRAAIVEALSKDPADRPRDAQAFATTLRRLQLGLMPPPSTPSGGADELARTEMIGDGVGSHTAVMPTRDIVAMPPTLGLTQQPYASRRQRRWLGVAALSAVIAVAAFALLRDDSAAGPLISSTTTAFAPTLVMVDPSLLIGRPAATAFEQLSKLGFEVDVNTVDAPGVEAGVVTGVEPSGQVAAGATVTISISSDGPTTTIADSIPAQSKGRDKDKDKD